MKLNEFIVPEAIVPALNAKERDGVLESEQIRRAIDRWLQDKKITRGQPFRSGKGRVQTP